MGFESSFSTKLVCQIRERTRELTGVIGSVGALAHGSLSVLASLVGF
jgi:hypothetical protein